MAGLNKCMIIGFLGRDPEVTYTQSGTAIAKITVATSETWNDKNTGEKREKTEWHRVTFFGKQAETIGKFMSKGSQIYVEGKLQTSQYEKDGITRYSTDVIASQFQFIGGRGNSQAPTHNDQQQGGGFKQQPQNNGGGFNQSNNGSGFQQNNGIGDNSGFQGPPSDNIPF